jgi:phosphoribosyl 1,2-cyclic phosphodiesterase
MSLKFTVLASGSQGNASLIQAGDFGVLIDCGVGPRNLAARLEQAGLSWQHVKALILTHTHGDHWHERTLFRIFKMAIPLYCHPGHGVALASSLAFAELKAAGLVRTFHARREFMLGPDLRCRALPIRHDSGATFGFRFDSLTSFDSRCSLAYLTDLGTWDADLAEAVANVDLLALEFNHDVEMERSSGRGYYLIKRVLGDRGHLSNAQAVAFVKAVLRRSIPGRLQRLVQLHLSDECNCPILAGKVARHALAELASTAELFTASQFEVSPVFHLQANAIQTFAGSRSHRRPIRNNSVDRFQPCLPGFDLDCAD